MNEKKLRTKHLRTRALGLAGAVAFIGLGSLGLIHGTDGPGAAVAGSGDAPTNEFVQPSDGAMTMGATATFTTPGSVEESTKAVPPIKAGS